MSVEATFATAEFMGEQLTFVDCPGSIDSPSRPSPCWAACDMAVVVAEADEKEDPGLLQLIMRKLDDLGRAPAFLFLNKVDKASGRRGATRLKMLQPASSVPLLFAPDFRWRPGRHRHRFDRSRAGARLHLPRIRRERSRRDPGRRQGARAGSPLLHAGGRSPDHDDQLMEQLLEEIEPPKERGLRRPRRRTCRGWGAVDACAESAPPRKGNGVLRLLKTIRHDAPDVEATRKRPRPPPERQSGTVVPGDEETIHTAPWRQSCRLSRILSGQLADRRPEPFTPGRPARRRKSPASTECSARTSPS